MALAPMAVIPARQRVGIGSEYDVPAETFMAIELCPGALHGVAGTVKWL